MSIIFAIAALALAAYFIKWMFAGRHAPEPALPSVYIEAIPPKTDPPATAP